MAEAIFNRLAEEKGLNVKAESFGIATETGLSISQNSALVCAEIGIDLSYKTSTAAFDTELEKYSKFFCMSQSHAAMLSQYFGIAADKISVLNVADPYGGDVNVYRQCRKQIYNSIEEIIKAYEN